MVLSVAVGFTFMILMGWVAGFITSATEVVYLCYIRDRDNCTVTRATVHAVLKEVPEATGAVVLQPDDNMVRCPASYPPSLWGWGDQGIVIVCSRVELFLYAVEHSCE